MASWSRRMDPQFERTMQNADEVIERCKHAYEVLADR